MKFFLVVMTYEVF